MSALPPPIPDEYNPYSAPLAAVDLPAPVMNLATRGQRLGAAVLDAMVIVPLGVVAAIVLPMGERNPNLMALMIAILVAAIVAIIVINAVGIYRNGQTIGKRLLGIRVVRSNGERVDFARYVFLRWLAIAILGAIPLLGGFITLLDALLIFRDNHKCLHDDFADTIVITL